MNPILEYYQAIMSGGVVVGQWVRMLYAMVVRALENQEYRYDARKAGTAIRFIEGFCRHHEGSLAPGKIRLELWQKAFIACLFGLVDDDGARHFREVVLLIGRKNGKTLLAAAIAACAVYIDGEYGARVYFCAPKLDQARLCYEAFFQMIQKEPELGSMAKKRRTDIYIEQNNASAMPLAFSAKKSDGLNPHLTVCDEIAAWPGDAGLKQYEVLKSALGARRQPILLSISTAGYVSEGIYDELVKRATAMLRGDSRERRLLPVMYMIDDPEKWNDIGELAKANPNLGVSVSVDYLLEEIAVAEASLSKRAEFLCKYCNVKQNSSMAWLAAEDIAKAFGETRTLADFRGCYCLGGIDLSQTTDLTACCVLVEKAGVIWCFCRFFMPSEKVAEATARDGVPYGIYAQRGLLTLSGDNFVDYHDCFRWFADLVEKHKLLPLAVGYDRYSAQYLVQDMEAYGFHMDSVFQGYNLTSVEDTFEGLLKSGLFKSAEDNDLLKLHLFDAAQQVETGTSAHARKKLVKISKTAHVDGVAAILDALCMRASKWTELGRQLRNEG